MNYLKAIGFLILQPFKWAGEGLLGIILMMWLFSGFGFMLVIAEVGELGHLGPISWICIVIDAALVINYSINFVKDKSKELERHD